MNDPGHADIQSVAATTLPAELLADGSEGLAAWTGEETVSIFQIGQGNLSLIHISEPTRLALI
eukprot:912820-Alexandrium_andersonii.AAC.1